jgi:hypothetical protein
VPKRLSWSYWREIPFTFTDRQHASTPLYKLSLSHYYGTLFLLSYTDLL